MRTTNILVVILVGSVASFVHAGESSLDRDGALWAPYVEWSLENPTFEGNPFDLTATATFVHKPSGERNTTGMFYDGGSTWKFRFTGARTGAWTFTTSSPDDDLNGKNGSVFIKPNTNPNAMGFITHHGNKWARPVGPDGQLQAFVPQLVMYAAFRHFRNRPEMIDADINTFLVEHGFNGFHVGGNCNWFDIEKMASDEIETPKPDPRTFESLELLITKTHAAGGMVHIWMWGDESRGWTPARWGLNGPVDQRMQRYLAARLGPLPGWTMGYGFDLDEWVGENDLRQWHGYLHRHFGWPHLLGARDGGPNQGLQHVDAQIFEGLDYASYEHHRPTYEVYRAALDARPGKPAFSEDRFRIRHSATYAEKDYDAERTRRGLWQSTMAGGVANIWGHLPEGHDGWLGSAPYAHRDWIKTYATFFAHRFLAEFVADTDLSDGVCLNVPDGKHYVFYKEDAASIKMDLSQMAGPQIAVAVDARQPYRELRLGRLAAEQQTWTPPHESDWAIAVGEFQ